MFVGNRWRLLFAVAVEDCCRCLSCVVAVCGCKLSLALSVVLVVGSLPLLFVVVGCR